MKCPICLQPYNDGQKFCSACGNPLPANAELKCPKCRADIEHGQKFCSVCGENLQPVHQHNVQPVVQPPITDTPQPSFHNHPSAFKITCPECGKPTDSLKQATLFNKLLFLMVYYRWQNVTYTCCPDCMRKHIADRSAATLITANFMWPLAVLPLHGYHLYKTYQPGHSKSVLQAFR